MLSIRYSIDNCIKITRIKPNFASLNNGLKCRKLVFMRVSGFILSKGSSSALIVGSSNDFDKLIYCFDKLIEGNWQNIDRL